jgi:hypothetical protein
MSFRISSASESKWGSEPFSKRPPSSLMLGSMSSSASVSGSVYVSDNDLVLESPSQHESESVAENGLDRRDG